MALPDDEPAPSADWVMTYGDMMSLLLTFFILLCSMSEIKQEQRYQAIAESLRRRFGYEMSTESVVPGLTPPKNSNIDKLASLGRARRADTLRGGDQVQAPVGEHPRVRTVRPGEHTTVGTRISFKGDSIDISEQDRRALRVIAQEVGGKPQRIEVRGHTSSRPLPADSPFKNHWDLAYARAVAVMEYLVQLGIEQRRIRISAAADHEPSTQSRDPSLLNEDERVEVSVLNELATGIEPTDRDRERKAIQSQP
ncbi:MAG: OmpA/MotB family protein [Planctomycetota bacterium]